MCRRWEPKNPITFISTRETTQTTWFKISYLSKNLLPKTYLRQLKVHILSITSRPLTHLLKTAQGSHSLTTSHPLPHRQDDHIYKSGSPGRVFRPQRHLEIRNCSRKMVLRLHSDNHESLAKEHANSPRQLHREFR